MDRRTMAVQAIGRWVGEFHLDQKILAAAVGISPGAISHLINDPGYSISEETARRIVAAVEQEHRTRINSLSMEVVALCHDTDFVLAEVANTAIIGAVKNGLAKNAFFHAPVQESQVVLPAGIRAVLIRIGGSTSPFFLIALNTTNLDEDREKRAVAHELEHLRATILAGLKNKSKPPRSSF